MDCGDQTAGCCHVKLFVRELLDMAVVRELPADAVVEAVTHPDGDFVFGNPPRQLQRIRVMGTVVLRSDVYTKNGTVHTVVYVDDATGVLAVVLRGECLDGTRGGDTMEQDGGIERFTWHSDRSAPVVGDVVDLFGRLRRGAHPALMDTSESQRYAVAAAWVIKDDAMQETCRALEIRDRYKEYFAGGFVGFREGATAATPVPKSCQAPSAALRMRQDACRPLSVTAVLRAVEQSGGTTRSGLCDTFGCTLNESAAQLDRCLSQLQEIYAIYIDGEFFKCL